MVKLLTLGFREQRDRSFWDRALDRLARRPAPPGVPRFGYLLEADGAVVGVLLLIFATSERPNGEPSLRCNVSSWYVLPRFSAYGTMLVSRALRHRQATYINITPAPQTEAILKAQGYARYCEGRFVSVPLLSGLAPAGCGISGRDSRVREILPDAGRIDGLSDRETALLGAHAEWGCLSVVCDASDSATYPFVFALRRRLAVVRLALLVYCRDTNDLARCAVPLGRFLARRGCFLAVLDADGPVPGLIGRYRPTHPKYFRGPDRPRLGDVAYSERAVFGV